MGGHLLIFFKDTKFVYYRFDCCGVHLNEHHNNVLLCLEWCMIIPSVPLATSKLLIRWWSC